MNSNEDLIQRRKAVVARGVGQFAGDLTAASGRGAILVDAEGKEWIDMAGGIGVVNVGHCDPRVVAAIREQAGRLIHASFNVATYEGYVALCEKLVELLPHGGPTKAMLVNSGAEAVENAVKIARQATDRDAVICFTGAFHGRTLLGMSLTSKVSYKTACGPFAPEIYRLPYPDRFHYGGGLSEADFVRRELNRMEAAFGNVVAATDVAAILIEPVLGEGGFLPAPFEYLRGLRELCDRHGILLICDEVQSGFCRTGRWASYEHAGIVPDLSAWAKAMGGGMPISAVIGKADVIDAALPGTIGGTYSGNPVACAAALASIETMEEQGLNARAEALGARMLERFRALMVRCPQMADVRGLGAMIGFEMCHENDPGRPDKETVDKLVAGCRERGVIVIPASRHGNVVRILCPLVIEDDQLDRALCAIEDSLLALTEKATA